MGLKLKKVTEKNTVKNNEAEVKLNLMSITCKKNLQQLAQYELGVMINRLKFLAEEHKLVPVIRNIEITFEPIMEANNVTIYPNLEHSDFEK
jgi:hypothetical protein